MTSTLIPLADAAAWCAALEGVRHPHAHTHAHVAAFHATVPDPTYLFVHRDGAGATVVACPVAVRGRVDEHDAYTPYGFGGFAADRAVPSFAEEWSAAAAANGWVASYVFQNPLLDAPLGFAADAFRPVGTTFVLDLSSSPEHLLARMSARRRTSLRRRAPGDADVTSDPDEVAAFLVATADPFFDARCAAPLYRLTATSWIRLVHAPTVWCIAVRERGTIVAASVFGASCGLVDYLFGISSPGASGYSAGLIWEAVQRFAATGAATLNLGGGIAPDDGVAEFKRRFGGSELPITSGRFVHRAPRFAELCDRAGVEPLTTGFFPPYRRPR